MLSRVLALYSRPMGFTILFFNLSGVFKKAPKVFKELFLSITPPAKFS